MKTLQSKTLNSAKLRHRSFHKGILNPEKRMQLGSFLIKLHYCSLQSTTRLKTSRQILF